MKRKLFAHFTVILLCVLAIIAGSCSRDDDEDQQKEIEYYSERLRAPDKFIRVEAAFKLAEIGEPAIPTLAFALSDGNINVNVSAIVALEQMGQPAVPVLIEALNHPNPIVRLNAADALGQIGDPNAVPRLITTLGDTDWEVRSVAVAALGKIGKNAVPGLTAALKHEDEVIRAAVVRTLGQIALNSDADGVTPPDTVAVLITVLSDEVWEVRAAAAVALGEIGTPAVPALIDALADVAAKDMAIWALKLIATPEALAAIEKAEQNLIDGEKNKL